MARWPVPVKGSLQDAAMVAVGYAVACQVTSTDPQAATQDDGDQDALNAATGGDGPHRRVESAQNVTQGAQVRWVGRQSQP